MEESIEYIDLSLYGNEILADPLQLFCQEIEIAVKTAPQEIWGCKDSIDLNQYVFNQYITINQIKNQIQNFIGTHCQHANYFQYEVDVDQYSTNGKEFIYICVRINSETGATLAEQKILVS